MSKRLRRVHITFVRSVELDEWTTDQLKLMHVSGNGNAASFFRSNGERDMYTKSEQKYTCAGPLDSLIRFDSFILPMAHTMI
jgi:hypothetical protein